MTPPADGIRQHDPGRVTHTRQEAGPSSSSNNAADSIHIFFIHLFYVIRNSFRDMNI